MINFIEISATLVYDRTITVANPWMNEASELFQIFFHIFLYRDVLFALSNGVDS